MEAPFSMGGDMTGYKLFRVKKKYPGVLFPLYVLADQPIPIGEWLTAEEGPRTPDGRVKSRLGRLAFRPGWHLSDIPLAIHIGQKEDGVIRYMHDDQVWCECEYSDEVNYQSLADENGRMKGRVVPAKAMLTSVPFNGYYRYRTSPVMLGSWVIAGAMKVNRVLTDAEVSEICEAAGYTALPRRKQMDLSEYGF